MAGALEGAGVVDAADAHRRAGTLGWLLLGVLAAAALMTEVTSTRDAGPGRLAAAGLAAAGLSAYALASWALVAELAGALVALVAVAAFGGSLVPSVRSSAPVTVPQLGILAALVVAGAVALLDLLPEVAPAARVPFRVAGARSPSIVVLAVLAGTALAEWRLVASPRPATTDPWGLAQVLLLLVGWVTLLAGTAADSLTLLVASVGFLAVAVVLFLGRLAPALGRLRWRGPDRWAGAALLHLAAYVGLLGHLAASVAGGRYLEVALVPSWLLFAVDHAVFVGVVANLFLGLGLRRAAPLFWAVNLGLVGTAVGLAAGLSIVAEAAAVVLGLGLLAGGVLATIGPNGTGTEPRARIASGA